MLQAQRKNSVFLTDFEDFPPFQHGDYYVQFNARHLSENSRKKAEKELNETLENRERAFKEMSKLIQQEEDLHIPHDNIYLMLKFLRPKKFDVEEAFQLMKNYFKFKIEFPELFIGIVPSEQAYIYAMNGVFLSPRPDKDGHKVVMVRVDRLDFKVATPMQIIASILVVAEGAMMDQESQVNGFVGVFDCSGFSYQHFKQISLSLMKICFRIVQNVMPVIPIRAHIMHQNVLVHSLYKLIKPFLPQQFIDMIHFHGDNYNELLEYVPKECLFEYFGGSLEEPEITEEEYRNFLKKFNEEYSALNSIGYKSS
ncbi:hypothetical protein DMENIID0001_153610 [Sergentomyia squamirostris]